MTDMNVSSPHCMNALTVDVEDYFQVSAFEDCIPRTDWTSWPQRAEANTDRLLELFNDYNITATFFVLGWIAERLPGLVQRIAEAGHEIASHGFSHTRLTHLTPVAFREEITHTRSLLEDISSSRVCGYRAPSYSINPNTLWAYEELQRAGYRYSSSIVPIHHDLYGMPSAPRFPFFPQPGVLEVPVTTLALLGRNWPCGGGGYFRLLPYAVFKWCLRHINDHECQPCIFYCHPWEIDPEQPRVPGVTLKNRFRHYLNLNRTLTKLGRLLRDFQFNRMDRVFLIDESLNYPVISLQEPVPCAE